MRALSPAGEREALLTLARERLSPALRSLVLFGSCLTEQTRRPGSIPDLFAIVDDRDEALSCLGVGPFALRLSRVLPPTTVALPAPSGSAVVAKLNVIEPTVVRRELAALKDLYIAGRLSKRTEVLFVRDVACGDEIRSLLDEAARAVVAAAIHGLPRRCTMDEAVRRCFELSYKAEIRPEREVDLRARFDLFADFYRDKFGPLIERRARRLGIQVDRGVLFDPRVSGARATEARQNLRLLLRSRLRSMARWPKQTLVYRGWVGYVLGKLRRSWAG